MRLSDAKSEAKPLEIQFPGDQVLKVEYRVPEYTPNQAAALMDQATKDPRRMGDMICRTVTSWDLTDDEGQIIELTPAVVSETIPMSVLGTIVKAINEDQMPGEAPATSSVG